MANKQLQAKYLRDRLQEIARRRPRRWARDEEDKPANVIRAEETIAKAQKVIDDHKKRVDEAFKKRDTAIDKLHNDCSRLIAFGDFDKALAAVDEFDKFLPII